MDAFYKKYRLGVQKFVATRVDNVQDAEELVNDILLAAYNSQPYFDGRAAEFTWICSIAKHKIIDYYRKKRIKTVLFSVNPVFEEIADKALGPEEESLKEELKEEIKGVMQDLGEGYRELLRLKYIDRLSMKQIALRLKLTVKAVESKLMRAKKAFRSSWQYSNVAKK
ncbi:sigma-70 family RNA polymerase sigma factor [Patescibacteria group bacterium]|nr:sigma-70 family RNA polymerase sigma factor [Patescibacteria group bacterium]